MGFLTSGEPVRVDLGRDYWVDLKPQLSAAEEGRAKRALASFTADASSGAVTGEPDVEAYQEHMVAASVVAWNLTDELDRPLPLAKDPKKDLSVTLRSVGQLPAWALARLAARVEELNAEPTPDEERSFPDGAADGASLGADGTGAQAA